MWCPVLSSSKAPSSTSHSLEFCPWRNATLRRGGMDCRPQVTELQDLGSKGCSKQIKATKCHWTSASSKLCGTASTCTMEFCVLIIVGKSLGNLVPSEVCEIKPCWWIPCFLLEFKQKSNHFVADHQNTIQSSFFNTLEISHLILRQDAGKLQGDQTPQWFHLLWIQFPGTEIWLEDLGYGSPAGLLHHQHAQRPRRERPAPQGGARREPRPETGHGHHRSWQTRWRNGWPPADRQKWPEKPMKRIPKTCPLMIPTYTHQWYPSVWVGCFKFLQSHLGHYFQLSCSKL